MCGIADAIPVSIVLSRHDDASGNNPEYLFSLNSVPEKVQLSHKIPGLYGICFRFYGWIISTRSIHGKFDTRYLPLLIF